MMVWCWIVFEVVEYIFLCWWCGDLEFVLLFGQVLQFVVVFGVGVQFQQVIGGVEFWMFYQFSGVFVLMMGYVQLQLLDIMNKGGDVFRDCQCMVGFVQYIVYCQGEGVVVCQVVFLSDFLCCFQQWILKYYCEEEGWIDVYIVMNVGIGIFQYLVDDLFYWVVVVFGKVVGDGWEQWLEQVVFLQQYVGLVVIFGLQQFEYFFEQMCWWYIVEQGGQVWQWFSCFWVDGYIEFGGKVYCVQYVYWIFVIVGFWVVDQMDYVVLQIFYVVDVVVNGKVCYVVIEVVDSEVVMLGIFFD